MGSSQSSNSTDAIIAVVVIGVALIAVYLLFGKGGNPLKDIIDKLGTFFKGAGSFISSGISGVEHSIGDVFTHNPFTGGSSPIYSSASGVAGTVSSGASGVVGAVGSAVSGNPVSGLGNFGL